MKAYALVLGLIFSLAPVLAHAQKTDVVFLQNGDRITGEIKRLEAGLLEFSTDSMGTINIEWRFILDITSDKDHSIEIQGGKRILGKLRKPLEGDHVLVETGSEIIDLEPREIVSVWPVRASFTERMDLDLSLGLDYSKATSITNLNTAVDFSLRGKDRYSEANLRSNITRQPGVNDQSRSELKLAHQYLLAQQRFRNWFGAVESNDALGVDMRFSAGGSFGKYFLKTNRTWFSASAGLVATLENPEKEDSEVNLEAVGNVRYRYFRYAEPERSLDSTLNVFPSITESGRIRSDFRTTFKLELISDLFWTMEMYATHDNKPLSENADKTDYGVITGVGWSY
jgi:hypothetical protein